MKKISIILIALISMISGLPASAENFTLGACGHKIAERGGYGSDTAGEIGAALYVPASRLTTLAGNSISRIDVGLISRINVRELTVWVRKDLKGSNLAEGFIERGSLGWNEIKLDTPYLIEENCPGLYIGFSYSNAGSSHPVSIVEYSGDYSTWLKTSAGEDWKDMTSSGILSIEAIVTGSSLPLYDLKILNAGISPDPAAGENAYNVSGTVTNLAMRNITGFTLEAEDNEGPAGSIDIPLVIEPGANSTFTARLEADRNLSGDIRLTAVSLFNGPDADMSNNSVNVKVSFTRNVLLEEFTTEKCPNCPSAAEAIHKLLESNPLYQTNVAAVCHHSAFNTDWLTRPCDVDLLFMFPDGLTYAPSTMINRLSIFREGYKQDKEEPIVAVRSEQVIESCINKAMEIPAHAILGLNVGEIRETADGREVEVKVSVYTDSDFNLEAPHLAFLTVENNINADYQEGAGKNFIHQHVIRTDNGAWGEPLEISDNTASKTFSVALDPQWKLDDLYFVAFVCNYDPQDLMNNPVENVAKASLISSTTFADGIKSDIRVVETARYDINGRRLSAPAEGLNIIVFSDGSTKKVFLNN